MSWNRSLTESHEQSVEAPVKCSAQASYPDPRPISVYTGHCIRSRGIAPSPPPVAVGTPITERPPHRSVLAAFPHKACMGLSLSRVHHAIFVVLCWSILLFDPRCEHSSVPTAYYCRRRAQRRSRTALLQRRRRLVLDGRERGGRLPRDRVIRCAMIRGEPAIGREQSREPRLYSVEPTWVPTMKQSYASAGKAPRRRVHSPSGIAAIAVCGLPPPRIVIGYPGASSAVRCRTLFVLSRSRVLLTPPAATRHRPAPHRS